MELPREPSRVPLVSIVVENGLNRVKLYVSFLSFSNTVGAIAGDPAAGAKAGAAGGATLGAMGGVGARRRARRRF